MTLETCAAYCAKYTYWGVEYGGECKLSTFSTCRKHELMLFIGYCGNGLNGGSIPASNQADCSFVCPGNKYEYCGAGNRLEMYKLATTSSSIVGKN